MTTADHDSYCKDLVSALSDEAPLYDRPFERRAPATGTPLFDASRPVMESLKTILATPDMCSRRWVWEQYDYSVMADTVQSPGGDAAVVRVHGSTKALAMTTDVTPRYCKADPYEGAKQAVAEAWRNITAVGAKPLAVTDNLNFGNPQKPEIMGEIVSLEALVRMKLTSYRRKDQVHIQDIIGVGLIDASWPARFSPELASRLQVLLDDPLG